MLSLGCRAEGLGFRILIELRAITARKPSMVGVSGVLWPNCCLVIGGLGVGA